MCTKKGFTLIELLVVISIIALLVAILMPALNAARMQATGAVCLSNTKSLSMAWTMYHGDNDDNLVLGGTDNFTYQSRVCKPWAYRENTNPGLQPKLDAIKRGLLFKYTKSTDVYNCPGDKRSLKPALLKPEVLGGFRTYSIAGGLFGVNPDGAWQIIPFMKASSIKSASEKYVFIEEMDGRGDNDGSWVVYPLGGANSKSWIDPLGIWHNKKSTLGFCDGHSEMITWLEKSTMDMSEKQNFYNTPYYNKGEKGVDLLNMQRGYAFKALQ